MTSKIAPARKAKCAALNILMYIAVGIICLMLAGLIGYILYRGLPHITLKFITSKPSLIRETIGILPNILNTVYIVLITLIIALPLGVGSAVYLNEYAGNKRVVRLIELAAETLSGIPSIIYGLVGMLMFVQVCHFGTSIMAGALTLVIMIMPTIIRTTQESLKTVPMSYREGALALGAGKWHMIRTVLLPSALDGIVTGCILSVGRIVGESAALLFTAGMANEVLGIFESILPQKAGSTLTVALYMYAKERGEFDTAFAIGAILLILVFIINILAKVLGNVLKKEQGVNMQDIIKAEGLNLWYGDNHVLKDVNIEIPENKITALIGPSGCGKSTFLKTLNRMNDLADECRIEGNVLFEGADIYGNVDINILRKRIGMVFQKPNPFPMSIYDNIAYGPRIHGIKNKSQLDEIVETSLKKAAIWEESKDRLKKSALGMSGGQQQRLCIARTLAVEPDIILMDEPTSALDPISTAKIEELALELREHYTIIIVTHNMQQAQRIADKTAFFMLGELIEYGDTEKLFNSPVHKRTEDYIRGRFG